MIDSKKRDIDYSAIFYFLRPYKGAIVILAGFAFLKSMLELLNVTLIYAILKWGLQASMHVSSPYLHWIEVLPNRMHQDPFIASCELFIASVLLLCIAEQAHVVYRSHLITRIVSSIQKRVYTHYVSERYAVLLRSKQGELIYNIVTPPNNLQTMFVTTATLCTDAVIFASLFAGICLISWKIAVGIVAVGIAYHMFTHYVSGAILFRASAAQQKADQELNVTLNETFNGIRAIKSSRRESQWIQRVNDIVAERLLNFQRRTIWKAVPTSVLNMLPALGLGIAGIVLRKMYAGSFYDKIPLFGAIGFALLRTLPHANSIVTIKMDIVSALPSLNLISQLLQSPPQPMSEGSQVFNGLQRDIVLDHVQFAHEGQKTLLSDFTLTLPRGKTTALVGASGIGKSTIVNLLLRLFEPSQGRILVDGIPLSEYSLDSWLQRIGFVGQEPFIIHGSVRENIVFGGSADAAALDHATQLAGAYDFIHRLPAGYDTLVGDQGFRLSGGERQRLCIARALLRTPDILILDEATSSLDNLSEAAIQKSLETIRVDRTVLIIAHRLSTVVNADHILVMSHEGIAESGTHAELIARRGRYWELYSAQTRHDAPSALGVSGHP